MEISSHTLFGTGKGCNRPIRFWWTDLFCWHIVQWLIKLFVSLYIPGQKNEAANRAREALRPEWPPMGVLWNSWRSCWRIWGIGGCGGFGRHEGMKAPKLLRSCLINWLFAKFTKQYYKRIISIFHSYSNWRSLLQYIVLQYIVELDLNPKKVSSFRESIRWARPN